MEDRDKIIRKIAALLARAADEASSPAEVGHAIHIAHKLMEQHNLSLDEVTVGKEHVEQTAFEVHPKESQYANILVTAIARLAQCNSQGFKGDLHLYVFTGLRVDVLYAEWLLRACAAAMKRGWDAFECSGQYEARRRAHEVPTIERHFKLGFSVDLARRMKALAEEDRTPNALVVVKKQRIEAALGEAAAQKSSSALVRVTQPLLQAFQSGAEASRSVVLRQQVGGGGPPVDTKKG